MRYRALPPELQQSTFRLPDAQHHGVGRARLRGSDVGHPFHGIYTHGVDLEDLRSRCAVLTSTLGVREWYSHVTAARLYGMPLPGRWSPSEPLHITSVGVDDRPRRQGVQGWRVLERPPTRRLDGGLRVVAPADVWATLSVRSAVSPGRMLSVEWMTAIADFLVSGARTDAGRQAPLCTMDELAAAASRRRGKRGAKVLWEALPQVRRPVDSVKETFLRLGLVSFGLPEPTVQLAIDTVDGIRHADLGYAEARLLLEFQGDQHRTSRRRWLDDLTRVQLFQDAGYRVFLIGDADIVPDCRALAQRVRRALANY